MSGQKRKKKVLIHALISLKRINKDVTHNPIKLATYCTKE